MDRIYNTTNELLNKSAEQAALGLRVSAAASEKLAVRIAQLNPLPENLANVLDLVEPTEMGLIETQRQIAAATDPDVKRALGHKRAMLKTMLARIEESLESC